MVFEFANLCPINQFSAAGASVATNIFCDLVFLDCDFEMAEDILLSVLPAWLAYRVVLAILEDKTRYSSQLVYDSSTSTDEPHQSLSYLVGIYYL